MRIVMTIHPNKAIRTFTCDEIITKERFGGICGDEPKEGKIKELFDSIGNTNLVKEVSLDRYEVRVEIVEAFEDSKDDWDRIADAAKAAIVQFFDLPDNEDVSFRVKDDRAKYARSRSDDY